MRLPVFTTKTAVVAIAAPVTLAALGYWGYAEFRAHQARNEIIASVNDTSLRLKASLAADAVKDSASWRRVRAHAEAVGAHFRNLHGKTEDAVSDLATAADDYLVTAREILLRRASSEAYRQEWSASIEALRRHMRADNRTGAWVSEAVRAKERAEAAYRDYSRAINALEALLGTLPASAQRVSPFIDHALLPDNTVVAAIRSEARLAARQAEEEMNEVRQLSRYR